MAVTPISIPASRAVRVPKKKALLIGIRYRGHETLEELDVPFDDVLMLKQFLIDSYGYTERDITVMIDNDSTPEQLQPTLRNIRMQAAMLVAGASPGDHFFFYYAGHSVQVPELSGEQHTEIDGLDEVMVPSDGRIGSNSKTVDSILTRETCLVDNELKRLLINPLPDGATFLAVLDACHSASLLDLDHDECNGDWICFPERPDAPGKWGQLLSFHNTHMPRTAPAKEATTNQRNTRPSVARRAEIVDNVRQHGACARIKNTKMPGTFPRCDSPLGDPSKTLVISLSACRDDQDACESKDGSFTQHLISILKKDPHHRPRLRDLMEQLSIAVHGMLLNSMNLQQLNKLGGCQDPQISSNGTVSLEAYLETL